MTMTMFQVILTGMYSYNGFSHKHPTYEQPSMMIFTISGVLAFMNLCFTALCAFIVLKNPPTPSTYPRATFHDAFCACILFSTGCFNIAIAWLRLYQAQGGLVTDWAAAICFIFTGLVNFGTVFIFLRARLGGRSKCQCTWEEKLDLNLVSYADPEKSMGPHELDLESEKMGLMQGMDLVEKK